MTRPNCSVETPGIPHAELNVGHPASHGIEQVVDVAPRVLAVDVQRVRPLGRRAERGLVVGKEADPESRRAPFVDRAAARGDRGGARHEVLDVGALNPGCVRVDPAAGGGRTHEAQVGLLHLRLDARRHVHLQCLVEQIDIAVGKADPVLRVGRVARAELQALGGRLDHRQRHFRMVGLRNVGIDRHLRAREVPRREEAANVVVECLLAVQVTRADAREIAHDLRRIPLEALDVDDADREGRAAFDRHRQVGAQRFRIDLRFARRQLGGCVRACRERCDGELLRGGPGFLPERGALRQKPIFAQFSDCCAASGRVIGGPGDVDRDIGNDAGRARRDLQANGHRPCAAVHGDVHACRKKALRCRGLARLGDGIAREEVEQIGCHVLVVLPADEVDRASQRGGDRRRRVYLDAIADRVVGLLRGCALGGGWRGLPVSGRRMRDGRRERQREKPEAPDARSSRSRRHSLDYRRPAQCSWLWARARPGRSSAKDR